MNAFVDVGQYQIVGTGQTIDEAKRGYRTALNLEDAAPAAPKDTTEISGRIEAAASAVISGNTCYYFTLEGETDIYTAFISVSEQLPFIRPGDTVHISFTQGGQVREIMAIEVDAGRN